MRSILLKTTAAAGVIALGVWSLPCPQSVDAADHNDPPAIAGGGSDIADLFAWHDSANDTMTVIVTFSGGSAPGALPDPDAGVLYSVHIDNDGDATTDEHTIDFQFGQNGAGDWGIQAAGVPGAGGDIVGPVGEDNADGAAHVWTGAADDPFFFDLAGFTEVATDLALGNNPSVGSFDNTRDSLAGANARGVVLEFPLSAVQNDPNPVNVWVSTHVESQG